MVNNLTIHKLLGHREKLLAFIRGKISDPSLAEDILQDSLLKALRAVPELRDEEKLVPWFYRILNNAIIDYYRRKATVTKYQVLHAGEAEPAIEPEDKAAICACFRELIPTLKPEYAGLIEELELSGGDPAQAARRLGLSRNNLKVRRHRARQALRQRLEEICRLCAKHGCLDCTCNTVHG